MTELIASHTVYSAVFFLLSHTRVNSASTQYKFKVYRAALSLASPEGPFTPSVSVSVMQRSGPCTHWTRRAPQREKKWSQVPFCCLLCHGLLIACSVNRTVATTGFARCLASPVASGVHGGLSVHVYIYPWTGDRTLMLTLVPAKSKPARFYPQ